MLKPLERIGYIRFYSSRCSRPINKSFSNSIIFNCQKVCSWLRRQALIDFVNHRKKTNRAAVLSCRPLPIFLNTGTTIWNRDSFREILKIAARSYEYLGSQFFRTMPRLQSGQGAFDKSRLVMTLTNLWVKGIVCNFRLSVEGTTGRTRRFWQIKVGYDPNQLGS